MMLGHPAHSIKVRRPAADHKAIAQAVDLIGKASNPIILAGNGAIRKRVAAQLSRLAQKPALAL